MSDIIRLLPDSVANQIAAGEVIQRPASVLKELVENAVDAGASEIEIIITDAGRTLIQVIDNGTGMSPTDARMAFERHATSKISNADDLFSLHTMGFRGEALASIAAIARVELRSKTIDSEMGTRLVINGSKVESQEAEICPTGSNIRVKNLFFNVPARRKFLKKDSVELANIVREFERLALVNPDIDLSITHNDSLLHRLRKGSLKQRIIDLFGKNLERQIVPVETHTPIVEISGFVSLPQFSKKRNQLQYLFVNGRNMRHPYFHKAIMMCFDGLIPTDEQPSYFISFKVDPETIDVNIHPTKNEIKFVEEAAIWQILMAAVKESLGSFNGMPGIDFSEDVTQMPVFNPSHIMPKNISSEKSYNPFEQKDKPTFNQRSRSPFTGPGADWERLYEEFNTDKLESKKEVIESVLNKSQSTPSVENYDSLPSLFEEEVFNEETSFLSLKGKYIVMTSKDGLLIIDRHRAHIRILYDRFMNEIAENRHHSQRIMFPEIISLSPAENIVMNSLLPELQLLGFEVTSLGGCDWNLTGYPSSLKDTNAIKVLHKIICDEADETKVNDNITERIALSMAKAAAIKSGANLTQTETETLVSQLFSLPMSKYTPDGQPIIATVRMDDIQKMFS